MRRLVASALTMAFLGIGLVGSPPTRAATIYSGQVNITTLDRLFDDTSMLQYSMPRRVRTWIDGQLRTAGLGPNTVCCRTDDQLLHDTALPDGNAVMLDRPLTSRESRSYMAQPVWIDGDVLVARPDNPSCAAGLTLAQARGLLEHGSSAFPRIYAPASPYDGTRVILFGLPFRSGLDRVYGPAVRIVAEQSAISAVSFDPQAIAAVAWSAARAAVAAGAVCELPINGITASPQSLRNRRYPASVQATFVVSRRHPFGAAWLRRYYLREYLPSAKARHLLETAGGRNRLLP